MDNNFDPGFFVEHFIKDMGIALAESKRMGLSMPGLALAHQLYLALQAQGHGRDGTHALELALAESERRGLEQSMKASSIFFAFGIVLISFSAHGAHPNIVYILADDLGFGDVGCNNPESKIPDAPH